MNTIYRAITTTIGAAVLAVLIVPTAKAGCGDTTKLQGPFQFLPLPSASPRLAEGVGDDATQTSIVGMWYAQFISEGNTQHNPPIPDGAVIDFGYAQWHGDATEMFNSGGRAPATQNFCLGVWLKTAAGDYQLNHFAYSYDATSGLLTNDVNIRELVSLNAAGNGYSGTFVINVLDLTGNQVDHLTGKITGQRLVVSSPVPTPTP